MTWLCSETFRGVSAGIHLAGGSLSIFDLNLGLDASVGRVKAFSFPTKLFRFKVVESKTTLCMQILDSLD